MLGFEPLYLSDSYGDASVFTHIPVRVTAANTVEVGVESGGARQADSASNANAPTIPGRGLFARQQAAASA